MDINDREGVKWLNAVRNCAYWEGERVGYAKAMKERIPGLLAQTGGFLFGAIIGMLLGTGLGLFLALGMTKP